jgi:hypothetical protein
MSRSYSASSTQLSYEEFEASRQPWDLLGELSAARALVVEFRNSLEEASLEMSQQFFHQVTSDVHMAFTMAKVRNSDLDDETCDSLEQSVSALVQQNFSQVYPTNLRLSGKDAETMSKLLRNVVEMAEKYKRIFDGITIGLDVDQRLEALLLSFVTKTILPNMAVKDRPALAAAVKDFLPQLSGAQVAQYTGAPPILKVVS